MNMKIKPLSNSKVEEYLSVKDLTKSGSINSIRLLYLEIKKVIGELHANSEVRVYGKDPIVTSTDNYDNLLVPKDNLSRSSTYTHYVNKKEMLRTHTSAHIPAIMRELSEDTSWDDIVIMLPGLVYRRDVTDRLHLGVCHQLDIWRIARNKEVLRGELLDVIHSIRKVTAPGWDERIVDMRHPYTKQGVEVNVVKGDRDIEILEAGLINERGLEINGLDSKNYTGWAMGMGLDRLVMTRKDVPDIRYIRSDNPKIHKQMHDLSPYKEVSLQPSITRDMSYCV